MELPDTNIKHCIKIRWALKQPAFGKNDSKAGNIKLEIQGKSRYAPSILICIKKHNKFSKYQNPRLGDTQDRLEGTEFGPESKCSKW